VSELHALPELSQALRYAVQFCPDCRPSWTSGQDYFLCPEHLAQLRDVPDGG
jgi:hypothetical protein